MRISLLLWVVVWSVSLSGAPPEFPGLDEKWRHLQSPNFELYSRNPEADSRKLLHDLELLHAMFFDTFKLTERRRLEVTIYFFRKETDFRAYLKELYGTKHNFAGIYMPGVDRAVILLCPGENAETTRQLIYHEYVHHMFRVAEQHPPSWLNEGIADLYSTVVPKAGNLEFGHPALGRLWLLQTQALMPLEQLFAVDQDSPVMRQGEHTGLFYAQSWALLHYLYFGESKIPAERRTAFVSRVLAHQYKDANAMRQGFQETFGLDYPEMLKRLERYATSGRYGWGKLPWPSIPTAASYAARSVSGPEMRLRLAELALRINRSPQAKLALLQVREHMLADTRPLETLGADALRDGDEQTARERWKEAVNLGTRNPAIFRELGLMEGRAVFSQFDVHFRVPAEKADRMRSHLLRAIEYSPEQTDAYEMLAWVEAFAPEPSIKNVTTVQRAYPSLTRKQRTALALAFVRVRLGKNEEALEILTDLETMQPDEWEVYGIEATRAFIENRPIKRENLRPAVPDDNKVKIQAPRVNVPPNS